MATLYIETTIIGYLTARSRDTVIFQARQELTREWWNRRRNRYDLVTSQLVVDEVSAGDPTAAAERLRYLDQIPLLDVSEPEISLLADELVQEHLLPKKARSDAEHVAIAAIHGIEYLLTWNCKHIANAVTLPAIYQFLRDHGHIPPLIVTPEEFADHE